MKLTKCTEKKYKRGNKKPEKDNNKLAFHAIIQSCN